ncbi:MAG: COQ9 family protein [Thermaurantiacus sp.]
MTDTDDFTLDELRPRLVEAMLPHVPFDGWTERAVAAAAADLGVDADVARLAFSGRPAAMVEAWIGLANRQMLEALDTDDYRALKVREKVTQAIRTRLEQATPHREAVRKAAHVLAVPVNAPVAARTTWATASAIWRAAGDTATDLNHYSKRALAGSVYAATLLVWLDDDSDGFERTWAFLDRRIAGVMRFEKWKAQLGRLGGDPETRPSLVRFLGRLRYPANQG